jgi:hypothetical protein
MLQLLSALQRAQESSICQQFRRNSINARGSRGRRFKNYPTAADIRFLFEVIQLQGALCS